MADLVLDQADKLYAAVGFRMTRIRKARGLTQEAVALAVGLTRTSIVNAAGWDDCAAAVAKATKRGGRP